MERVTPEFLVHDLFIESYRSQEMVTTQSEFLKTVQVSNTVLLLE